MFVRIMICVVLVSAFGCSARHTEGPQQPAETASSQPEPMVGTPVTDPEPAPIVAPVTPVVSKVATTDALHGRWELKTITVGSATSEALAENSLIVHFCSDGRAKFERNASKDYYDGFQLDTAAQPWEIILLKENAQSQRLLMRFVENSQEVVDYAPLRDCPANKKCMKHDWKTMQATSLTVNQIHRSTTPANCD